MIDEAIADGIGLIITCDNGIAAAEPVKKAKNAGILVIVTDHHEIPFSLREDGTKEYQIPAADAIVEPKLPESLLMEKGASPCPFPDICGAVVAMKLMQVLLKPEDPNRVFESEFLNRNLVLCSQTFFPSRHWQPSVMSVRSQERTESSCAAA